MTALGIEQMCLHPDKSSARHPCRTRVPADQQQSDGLRFHDRETSAKDGHRINAPGMGTVLTVHACLARPPFMASRIYM